MLLPGDSPGFDFGKPVWTNQLFVVAPAHQSAVVQSSCVGRRLLCSECLSSVSLQGAGAGMALRAALCQCVLASIGVCIYMYTVDTHTET